MIRICYLIPFELFQTLFVPLFHACRSIIALCNCTIILRFTFILRNFTLQFVSPHSLMVYSIPSDYFQDPHSNCSCYKGIKCNMTSYFIGSDRFLSFQTFLIYYTPIKNKCPKNVKKMSGK
jgi:hypothetical protein